MPMVQDSLLCLSCGKTTLHARNRFSDGIGCILSLFTCGLFLPLWFLIILIEAFHPTRCQACGLPYSHARVKDFYKRQAAHRAKRAAANAPQAPPPVSAPAEPSFDFAAAIRQARDKARDFAAGSWAQAVELYRRMPDWLQPIFWALALTGPLGIVAVVGRLKGWW
jgi:hypothetical protein